MRIDLEPLSAEHLIEIHSLDAVECHLNAEQLTDHWQSYQSGPAFVGREQNKPGIVAAAGVITMWNGVGEGWAILSPRAKGRAVLRAFQETFRLIQIAHNYHRIQAAVRADFTDGIRFANWMGFESEGVMEKYNAEKQDFVRMAKVLK